VRRRRHPPLSLTSRSSIHRILALGLVALGAVALGLVRAHPQILLALVAQMGASLTAPDRRGEGRVRWPGRGVCWFSCA